MRINFVVALLAILLLVSVCSLTIAAGLEGYTKYVDEEYGFSILYPETWESINFYSQEEWATIDSTEKGLLQEGQETGVMFGSDTLNSIGLSQASIMVMVVSDREQARFWESEEYSKMTAIITQTETIINGRQATQTINTPWPGVMMRHIVVDVDDLYYTIIAYANEGTYDKYASTFDTAINSFENPAPIIATPTPEEDVPGFETVFAIAGLFAVAYLLRRMG